MLLCPSANEDVTRRPHARSRQWAFTRDQICWHPDPGLLDLLLFLLFISYLVYSILLEQSEQTKTEPKAWLHKSSSVNICSPQHGRPLYRQEEWAWYQRLHESNRSINEVSRTSLKTFKVKLDFNFPNQMAFFSQPKLTSAYLVLGIALVKRKNRFSCCLSNFQLFKNATRSTWIDNYH